MTKNYVIYNSGGDTHVKELSDADLEKRLSEEYYGDVGILNKVPDSDTNYWGDSILIIRGEIVDKQDEMLKVVAKKLSEENLSKEEKLAALAKLSDEDKKILGIILGIR